VSELVPIDFVPGSVGEPLEDAELRETEDLIGRALPARFVELLRRTNGGVPVQRYFSLGDNVKVVERFLCVVRRCPENEATAEYHVGAAWSQVVDRLMGQVPFAALFPGDFLCFDYNQGEPLPVVWWNHDKSREDRPHLTPVAPSLAEFLKMLRAAP
jgi:hypothetical protein